MSRVYIARGPNEKNMRVEDHGFLSIAVRVDEAIFTLPQSRSRQRIKETMEHDLVLIQ